MRSCVKINLTKENIQIKLNEEASQKEIVDTLKKKVTGLKKLYKDEMRSKKLKLKILYKKK